MYMYVHLYGRINYYDIFVFTWNNRCAIVCLGLSKPVLPSAARCSQHIRLDRKHLRRQHPVNWCRFGCAAGPWPVLDCWPIRARAMNAEVVAALRPAPCYWGRQLCIFRISFLYRYLLPFWREHTINMGIFERFFFCFLNIIIGLYNFFGSNTESINFFMCTLVSMAD